MSIFKCKMCGGTLEINADQTTAICEYCGTQQTLPKLDNERRANLYDRANHFRRNNEFDKAMAIYENILNEDITDAEAYWSLVLCRYGIEYIEDPTTRKRVPTVNRAQFTSIFEDDNYKSALQYADNYQRAIYEQEAVAINEIQKGILAISQKEEPFDIFICYKETDKTGRRTRDSVLANDLYHQLTAEGYKVFFSRITLEDKLGVAYEPYIFAALNSAKIMVVVGTKPEYFNTVWVKNEWSRYLALVKQSGGKKILIPAYRDMDPYDLPEEFSHLQAQDMSKLGFMQDLIRGIKKLTQDTTPKATTKETVIINNGNVNVESLLKRAFMYLEDGEWESADEYCEKVLDQDPENASGYLGKLMAELEVCEQDGLRDEDQPFNDNKNYEKLLRFADEKLKTTLTGYIEHIKTRNEETRLNEIYNRAKKSMLDATTENAFIKAALLFESISDYQDSITLANMCHEKAKDVVLADGKSKMQGTNITNYENAIRLFKSVPGWKDADEQIYICKKKIEELKAREEAQRLENKRKAELLCQEAAKKTKQKKHLTIITTSIACSVIAIIILLNAFIIPNGKYNDAIALMDAGKYTEAISSFNALEGYKDSEAQIKNCEVAILDNKYNDAIALMDAGKYTEAISAFTSLEGHKDSETQIKNCEYSNAIELMNAGKYSEAITAFTALESHKDSEIQIQNCEAAIWDPQYNNAVALMEAGNSAEAYEAFIALHGYKDSIEKAHTIYEEYQNKKFKSITVGSSVFFGTYEQDNISSNGKEDIEWLVLDIQDNKALVISSYILDCQPYNRTKANVTWETCSLRDWLNSIFIDSAFSKVEKSMISISTVSAEKYPGQRTNPGNNTQDRVFLLSVIEENDFLDSESSRRCMPTAYAKIRGVSLYNQSAIYCPWWLRSTGTKEMTATYIHDDILKKDLSVVAYDVGIRPAMWINLD